MSNQHDPIHEAALSFQKAIEATGKKNVMIVYGYLEPDEEEDTDNIVTGYHGLMISVIGLCHLMQARLIQQGNDGISNQTNK